MSAAMNAGKRIMRYAGVARSRRLAKSAASYSHRNGVTRSTALGHASSGHSGSGRRRAGEAIALGATGLGAPYSLHLSPPPQQPD